MNGAMIPPGVTVFCDPTLGPVIRRIGAGAGLQVAVLSAPAPLMLAQITRHTRNDVLFTLSGAMDQAEAEQLVRPATRQNGFRNTLVLAALQGWRGNVRTARVAVTDPTVISGLDGRAVLAANSIATGAILGAANTGDVADLITTGAADLGLLYLTDVKANPHLRVAATLEADPRDITYAAAVNAHAVSPNAQGFLNFLARSGAGLAAGGLVRS